MGYCNPEGGPVASTSSTPVRGRSFVLSRHNTNSIITCDTQMDENFIMKWSQAAVVLVGATRAGWRELGRFPFRTKRSEFDPGHGGDALGAWMWPYLLFMCSSSSYT